MNKFEQLIEYVINDDEANAKALFHEIVVDKSRDIYEEIMAEESQVEEDTKASWPKSDDDEDAPQVGDTVMHDKYGMLTVVKVSDTDMMGEPAEYIVQTKSGKKKISFDQLVMGESVNEEELGGSQVDDLIDTIEVEEQGATFEDDDEEEGEDFA